MKKNINIINFILAVFVVIFILVVFDLKREEKKIYQPEYLIDIWIENVEEIDLKYIEMGILLNGGQEEIINLLDGDNVNRKKLHFTINFSQDTQFFLRGKSVEKSIEPCYFDLTECTDTNSEQEIRFYIEDYKIYKY